MKSYPAKHLSIAEALKSWWNPCKQSSWQFPKLVTIVLLPLVFPSFKDLSTSSRWRSNLLAFLSICCVSPSVHHEDLEWEKFVLAGVPIFCSKLYNKTVRKVIESYSTMWKQNMKSFWFSLDFCNVIWEIHWANVSSSWCLLCMG